MRAAIPMVTSGHHTLQRWSRRARVNSSGADGFATEPRVARRPFQGALERIAVHSHARRGRLLAARSRIEGAGLAKTEWRHVDVDVLVGSGTGYVSLVPYAHGTIDADGLVERPPSRQMLSLFVSGIGEQLIQAAPVLHHDRRTAEPH